MDPVDELLDAWRATHPQVLGPESELVKRVLLLADAMAEVTTAELFVLGLTGAEFDVLATLRRTGPPHVRTPTELTRALLLSSGGTSNVVKRLVARGLVERRPDPGDARSTHVVLTESGARLAEKAVAADSAAQAGLLSEVDPAAITAAADALRAVFAGLRHPRRPGARYT